MLCAQKLCQQLQQRGSLLQPSKIMREQNTHQLTEGPKSRQEAQHDMPSGAAYELQWQVQRLSQAAWTQRSVAECLVDTAHRLIHGCGCWLLSWSCRLSNTLLHWQRHPSTQQQASVNRWPEVPSVIGTEYCATAAVNQLGKQATCSNRAEHIEQQCSRCLHHAQYITSHHITPQHTCVHTCVPNPCLDARLRRIVAAECRHATAAVVACVLAAMRTFKLTGPFAPSEAG